jgi:UDP-N-acetylmuramoylalanine--D-glutamate ligase
MTVAKPFFVIIGLGKTGLSCAKYCLDNGIDFAVTDSRSSPPEATALEKLAPNVQVAFGHLSSALIQQATTLLVSPGIAIDDPAIIDAVSAGTEIIGDVELFMRRVNLPIVGVTGSNGKTTVTSLVGEMMKQCGKQVTVAGNIGLPVLDTLSSAAESSDTQCISRCDEGEAGNGKAKRCPAERPKQERRAGLQAKQECVAQQEVKPSSGVYKKYMSSEASLQQCSQLERQRVYVLELSSFQLEYTPSIHTQVAALLNICEDHLDRYQDMESYLAAKKRIFHHCQTAVVCRHDSRLYPDDSSIPCISFGLDVPTDGHFGIGEKAGEKYLLHGHQHLLAVNDLRAQADHQLLNILAALAIGHAMGLDMSLMLTVAKRFTGLPHRCQLVDEFAGVRWYNDSKATNVAAAMAALTGFGKGCDGKVILIAGGQGKGMDFLPLRPVVKQFARKVIVMGEMAKQLQVQLADVTEVEKVNSMAEAVSLAELTARRGDVVLLSPACASFDMFNNFEHRGETFMKLVKAL